MTRFARYSTKGIKKPPLDASPWSELAPPSTGRCVASTPGTASTSPATGMPGAASTSNSKKSKRNATHQLGPLLAISTDKKKSKNNAKNPLSLPQKRPDDDNPVKVKSPKLSMKIEQSEERNKQIKMAAKKKAKSNSVSVAATGLEIDADNGPALNVPESIAILECSSRGKKRKRKGANTPMKKKQCQGVDAEATDLPAGAKDQHQDEFSAEKTSETAVAKTTFADINGGDGSTKINKKNEQKKVQRKLTATAAACSAPVLAEGPLMTQFEGYWVRRRAVPRLEQIRAQLAAAISDPQTLKRQMKKRKRAEHRLLLSQLAARDVRKPPSAAARLQNDVATDEHGNGGTDEELETKSDGEHAPVSEQPTRPAERWTVASDRKPAVGAPCEQRMVKFDGVWMTADAVGRLKELRRQLKLQRVSELVLKQTMKTARRREEMKRKRDAKRVCLGCRQPGHFISDCPNRAAGLKVPVTGICFHCGSTEHRLSGCRRVSDGGRLPYAVCFVCGKTGHMARDCSLNPNGVYPKGGACKVCHRRDHLADDCPERKEEDTAAGATRLATIGDGPLEDDYQHDFRETQAPAAAAAAAPVTTTPRRVKF